MKNEAYLSVIKLGRPHALSGQLKAHTLHPSLTSLSELKSLFIQQGRSYIPYFIQSIQILHENFLLLKLEEVDSKEDAQKLSGATAFLKEADFEKFFTEHEDNLDALEGFKAYDQKGEFLGLITEMVEMPGQTQAAIDRGGKEVLIPMHEDMILKILKRKKEVHFDLPEGYLDIFG